METKTTVTDLPYFGPERRKRDKYIGKSVHDCTLNSYIDLQARLNEDIKAEKRLLAGVEAVARGLAADIAAKQRESEEAKTAAEVLSGITPDRRQRMKVAA